MIGTRPRESLPVILGDTFYDMHCGAYDQHLDNMFIEDHKDPSTVDWWR